MKDNKWKCKVCGKSFMSNATHADYCEACRPLVNRIKSRVRYKKIALGKNVERKILALCRQEKRLMEIQKIGPSGTNQCPFCGKRHGRMGAYCSYCVQEGFDNIHKLTGRTNGWDRKMAETPHVRSEWRGQRTIGGGLHVRYD